MTPQEVKEQIALLQEAAKEARAAQADKDNEALLAVYQTHGVDGVMTVDTPAAPPLPTKVVIIAPDRKLYDYWVKTMRRPGSTVTEKVEADYDLASKIVVYPDKEVWKQLIDKHSGVISSVVNAAGKLAGLAVNESGKE